MATVAELEQQLATLEAVLAETRKYILATERKAALFYYLTPEEVSAVNARERADQDRKTEVDRKLSLFFHLTPEEITDLETRAGAR